MENSFNFYLNAGVPEINDLISNPASITLVKANGEKVVVSPTQGRLSVKEEQPQVDRMEGDWGAICEVFKQNRYYYLALPEGLSPQIKLDAGDAIVLRFQNRPASLTLYVVEIENGRVRIAPPKL